MPRDSTLPQQRLHPRLHPSSSLDHGFRVLEEGLVERLRNGELEADVDRLRRFFFKPWAAFSEIHLSPNGDPEKLERWREAPAHSPESVKASAYDRAIRTLLLWQAMRSG